MRIKGVDPAAPPVARVQEATATSAPGATETVEAVAPTAAVSVVGEAVAVDAVADIARRVRAGELDAHGALEQLIDEIVDRQVGRAAAEKHALAARLRAHLHEQAQNDPFLAAHVRRLRIRA